VAGNEDAEAGPVGPEAALLVDEALRPDGHQPGVLGQEDEVGPGHVVAFEHLVVKVLERFRKLIIIVKIVGSNLARV
jgi:hypothetical protein